MNKFFAIVLGALLCGCGPSEKDKAAAAYVAAMRTNVAVPAATNLARHLAPHEDPAELAKQPQREAVIQKLLEEKIFTRWEKPGKLPHLYVGAAFQALEFQDKRVFVNAFHSYHITADPNADIVVLHDGYTGKEIGTYSPALGLKIK